MHEVIRDPSTGNTGVDQHVSEFSGFVGLCFCSEGLYFELAGKKIDLVLRSLVGVVRFHELPVLWSVKMRSFERSRPQYARGIMVVGV